MGCPIISRLIDYNGILILRYAPIAFLEGEWYHWACSEYATYLLSRVGILEAREREVLYYLPRDGQAPFRQWREHIADRATKLAVDARIARMRAGNFGDSKTLGSGVYENRIDFGPGYRIYYGIDGPRVILLRGGDKSSQAADVESAREFWRDYKERKQNEAKRELQGRSSRESKN